MQIFCSKKFDKIVKIIKVDIHNNPFITETNKSMCQLILFFGSFYQLSCYFLIKLVLVNNRNMIILDYILLKSKIQ